jgi:hypothetical protein
MAGFEQEQIDLENEDYEEQASPDLNNKLLPPQRSYQGDFDLMDAILTSLSKMMNEESNEKVPDDNNTALSLSNTATKGDFAKSLKAYSIRHKLTGAALSDLLCLLKESVPEVNWPIQTSTKGNVSTSVAKYCSEDYRMLEFHVCPLNGKYKNFIFV